MAQENVIIVGDALQALQRIADNTIDCCITSPPYYGLRDYGVAGQIGLENSPQEYIEKLVEVFREVRRVLKPDGTLWLNIADSYAGSSKGAWNMPTEERKKCKQTYLYSASDATASVPKAWDGIKPKDLIGIPWMLAFALRADGWFLRQDIIWYKPNCMPESVKDRCTKSHEYIFLLSKSKRYYFDAAAIKEPAVGFDNCPPAGSIGTLRPNSRRRKGNARTFRGGGAYTSNMAYDNSAIVERKAHGNVENTTGLRNKRDVWSVSTRGFSGAHFATFPEKLIEPCVLAGCREGGVILDPFFGSGTTGKVAQDNGRAFIGIELNPEYGELAAKRTGGNLFINYGRKKHER